LHLRKSVHYEQLTTREEEMMEGSVAQFVCVHHFVKMNEWVKWVRITLWDRSANNNDNYPFASSSSIDGLGWASCWWMEQASWCFSLFRPKVDLGGWHESSARLDFCWCASINPPQATCGL
jgi:hypothetical protein